MENDENPKEKSPKKSCLIITQLVTNRLLHIGREVERSALWVPAGLLVAQLSILSEYD